MKPCVLFLTCKNNKEADKINKTLFERKLIVCSKKLPVNSSFLWKGKIDSAKEVLVMYETIEENFEKINREVKKIHSYDIYVLFSLPITQTTKEVKNWMKEELNR